MFTGIIQTIGTVDQINDKGNEQELCVTVPWGVTWRLKRGASIAVAGVCLTVVNKRWRRIFFDLSHETRLRTSLGECRVGDRLNIERSVRVGDEIGGHPISGHVYGVGTIVDVDDKLHEYTFQVDTSWMQHIHQKGFIAIDGCSLTVINPDPERGSFAVAFIPETLRSTTFGEKKVGDRVNIELDLK